MRAWLIVGVLVMSLAAAPASEAKLIPKLDRRVAAPGETVVVKFGPGVERFLAPLEVYLVSTAAEPTLTGRRDPRLRLVGRVGSRDRITSHTLPFRVPPLPPGRYTLAVYFRGAATGRWHNLAEGLWRDPGFRDGLLIRIRRG